MLIIPHAKSPGQKGCWWWFRDRIVVSCPFCGVSAQLDHEVDVEGNVSPSVVCATSTCPFHDNIKLSDF